MGNISFVFFSILIFQKIWRQGEEDASPAGAFASHTMSQYDRNKSGLWKILKRSLQKMYKRVCTSIKKEHSAPQQNIQQIGDDNLLVSSDWQYAFLNQKYLMNLKKIYESYSESNLWWAVNKRSNEKKNIIHKKYIHT